VAILYRFPFSVIFTLMVIFLSGLPWMGLTVLVGCVLASLKPFKFSFRYASALVGLIPVALYFVMASWEPAGSAVKSVQNKALLYAPWVLALLSSCVICAVVLALAKLINYRPGGVSPVLAALFAVPVLLFYAYVGRDELDFRILESQIGPQNPTMFAAIDVGAAAHLAATRQWSRLSGESYDAIHRRLLEEGIAEGLQQTEIDRNRAVELCEEFIRQFSKSRHVPSVYFLKGQAQDQRIQRNKLLLAHRIEYRNDLPSPASLHTWETIREKFPDNELSVLALYKLSILEARAGRLDQAVDLLSELLGVFDPASASSRPAAPEVEGAVTIFLRSEPSAMRVDRKLLLLQARRLREMLLFCRADSPRAYNEVFAAGAATAEKQVHPAQLLLCLDDTDPLYAANLQTLARTFPNSHTTDYVRIRRTLLETAVSRRILQFRHLATELAGSPAGAEALYHLGEVLQEDSLMDEARTQYQELTRQYPESCWTQEAKERLSSLSMIEPTAG
jgi:outer membrane protein assembly factor BamD (BamD/ComL family)